MSTATASEYGQIQAQEPTEVIDPASQGVSGAATPAGAAPVGLNFLQADELNGAPAPVSGADEVVSEAGQGEGGVKKEGLEEYEVVPAMQAHEVGLVWPCHGYTTACRSTVLPPQ